MSMSKSLAVGVYGKEQHLLALLRAILTFAGHTIVTCGRGEQALGVFLEALIEHLVYKPEPSPPYHLLIIAVPSSELAGRTLTFLERLAALELFPVVLLTENHHHNFELLRTRVTVIPFLFQNIFRIRDLVDAIEMTTGIPFPLSLPSKQILAQWQQEQYWEAIQARQTWIDRRQEWLKQQREWITQRDEWLLQRRLWIDMQCQEPDAQYEWLQEQQLWIERQQVEVDQQNRWTQQRQHWLKRQQTNLDLLKQQHFVKDAT